MIFPFLSKDFSLIWKTLLNPYGITRAIESRCVQDLSWLEIRAKVLRFDSCSFISYLYPEKSAVSFFPSFSILFIFTIYHWTVSLNFIRLLRVVITPSVVERTKRLEAIGWISGYWTVAPNKNIVQNHLNIALLNVF